MHQRYLIEYHVKLFNILCQRGICPSILRLLYNMYTHSTLNVKWNGKSSSTFDLQNGVKQGGVFSPILIIIYMDGLLLKVIQAGFGCHVGSICAGVFGYASI